MLAISTEWNSARHPGMGEMLDEISQAGLEAIELGYRLSGTDLDRIASLREGKGMKVVSVHNFCPLPPKSSKKRFFCDYYRISSPDEQERRDAVEFTRRTIDTACRFSAAVVVVHAGMVELRGGYGRGLLQYFREGTQNTPAFYHARDSLLRAREAAKAPFLSAAEQSLEEILSYAQRAGVRIGLENRYYPAEIPNIEEAGMLLERYHDRGLGYWHDTGHAEVNERLGITGHSEYLESFSGFLAGMHIHDLKGLDDHLAPFTGECDYRKIVPYLREDIPLVIEAHGRATPEEIRAAAERLRSFFPRPGTG